MSRVYNTYCDTRDDIYIAMGDAGLSEGLFKQLHNEQGRDAVAYVIRGQLGKEPIFFDEALDQIIKEVNDEYNIWTGTTRGGERFGAWVMAVRF